MKSESVGTMPTLNRYAKRGTPDPLEAIKDKDARRHIVKNATAASRHVQAAFISMGLLQLYALEPENDISSGAPWRRTVKEGKQSEWCAKFYAQHNIVRSLALRPENPITRIIREYRDGAQNVASCEACAIAT